MSLLVLAWSTLVLGFLHGLGGDHLMAIAALATGSHPQARQARVVQTAFGFALGHTLVLGAGAVVAVAFGLVLPAWFESGAEKVGGALLVAFGIAGLWGIVTRRTFGHVHVAGGRTRWHWHLGIGTHPHGHSRLPTLMGAVFAFSSLRALMLLQPFGSSAMTIALPALLLLVVIFGVGILLSMSLFGVLLARLLSLRAIQALGRIAAGLVAVASIALGIYWMRLS